MTTIYISLPKPFRDRIFSRCITALLTGLITLTFFIVSLHAQTTRFVNGSRGEDTGDCTGSPCQTINYTMDQADPDDLIDIATGTYTETLTIDKNLSLHGAGEASTIIQAHGRPGLAEGRVITISGAPEVDISNVTIRHGNPTGDTPDNQGGGIYNTSGSLTLTDVIISNNSAEGGGGGLFNESSSPVLTNVAIINNKAGVGGGGVANNEGSSPALTNVTIRGNSVAGLGGGLVNVANSSPILINCVISGNSADDGGGLLNFTDSSPILTNVTISGNVATNNGGGIHNESGSSPRLDNVIIWNNVAEGSSTTASASIFNGSGDPLIFHSLIANSGGSGEGWDEEIGIDGGNNIDTDPLFIDSPDPGDAPTASGNMRLRPGSPAVNAGTNIPFEHEGMAEHITTDLDGNSRIRHETVDIGAYEWGWEGDSVVYVNGSASGENDGRDWQNAYTGLQTALWTIGVVNTSIADQIWVAAGTYVPANDPDDRDASFQLINGVSIYGGFAGNEGSPDERDWTLNETILSGDINGNGEPEGNSYTVVTASGTDETAVLDGFIVTGGNSDSSGGGMYIDNGSPTLTNLIITGNTARLGGGMYNRESSPILTDITFSSNAASNTGGGMFNSRSTPSLVNTIFSGNSAGSDGGGIANDNSSPVLINVTFSGNSATSEGGGMYNEGDLDGGDGSFPSLNNVIIWNNLAGGSASSPSASIFNDKFDLAIPIIQYSLIEHSGSSGDGWNNALGKDLDNNIDADPLFVDTPDPVNAPSSEGDVRVLTGSPAINAGTNEPFEPGGAAEGITADLDGNPRIQYGAVDMGAYEWSWQGGSTIFVKDDASGSDDGRDWDNANTTLYGALRTVGIVNTEEVGIDQVWVAAGTYTPTDDPDDREASFRTLNGVSILGGFAGAEENANERDWVQNNTILSGDINASGDLAGNSYHVLIGDSLNETSVIDGFTVTGGNADGIADEAFHFAGGGMFNVNSSPKLSNIIFSGNSARAGGGMVNFSGSSPTLINVSITGNSATDEHGTGGGIANSLNSSPTLTNVTISGNTASASGGGMANSQSSPTLKNVIIWNNRAGGSTASASASISNDASSEPSISYSLIANSGGSGDEWDTALGIDAGNNFDGNPVFVQAVAPSAAPTTDGDYRLEFVSDAIDAGTNDAVMTLTDLDGYSRIVGGAVDAGAYEYQSANLSVAREITQNNEPFGFGDTFIEFSMIGTVAGDPPLLFVDYNNSEPENIVFDAPPPDNHGESHWVIAHAGGPFGVATMSVNNISDLTDAGSPDSVSLYHRNEGEGTFSILETTIDEDRIVAEVSPFGEFILGWNDVPVSVDKDPLAALPQEFMLHQNFPNPFNPSTVIQFDIPFRSHVLLEVYNVLGQPVALLVDEHRPAGYYTEHFDAGHLASGIYFYRIQAEDFVEVRKLMLLR